jgi:hypothetical protein
MADSDDDKDRVDELVFLAAHSASHPGGVLLIDEIKSRANFIRAARKARWRPSMIAPLEADLLAALRLFFERAKWYEGGLAGPPPIGN